MGRVRNTWALMGASWDVLKADREIMLFPFLSSISCLLVLLSFILPFVVSGMYEHSEKIGEMGYVILFLFYLANYTVITFFNSAVVACVHIRLQGGDPTVRDGFKAALQRLPVILGWALVSATVGLLLRMIENNSKFIGSIVAGILGVAWTLTSFLVVPMLVIENMGPIEALKNSAAYFKKTWGEQLVGNYSFGLVFFLLGLLGMIPLGLGLAVGVGGTQIPVMLALIGIAVIYWMGLSLIQSTLSSIFQTALYLYVKEGDQLRGFPTELLDQAYRPR